MNYRFDEPASEEFLRAARYCAQIDRRLGDRFIEEAYRTVSLVLDNPYLGQRVSSDHRRSIIQRFPYSLIYRVRPGNGLIEIVAVVDQRRRPVDWRSRVEEAPAVYQAVREAA